MARNTIVERVWTAHSIGGSQSELIYIDMHLLHELTSPQAFEGLRTAGRKLRRPDLTVATADHDVPTNTRIVPLNDAVGRRQLQLQIENCQAFGVELHPMNSEGQGIVHVIGPQMGLTQPGMTIVCGDSHTATHGAFGAVAFGIGTSQVEHVMATQTLRMTKPKSMLVEFHGTPHPSATPKDVALRMVAALGPDGGAGHLIEFQGDVIDNMSMEGRMTLCNMAIEAGARSGIVAPDATTFDYLKSRDRVAKDDWDLIREEWGRFSSAEDAEFDTHQIVDVEGLMPMVTWGTLPSQAIPVSGHVPDLDQMGQDDEGFGSAQRALSYMGLRSNQRIQDVEIDTVFIGSCTNGRLEDLRAAADVLRGRVISPNVTGLVVPGSEQVRRLAESEGLDKVFLAAGLEWRFSGCSMCIAMNGDTVANGKHSASTSNRNFENRQGPGARTHIVSPATAAATAVLGRIGSIAELKEAEIHAQG